MVRESMWIERRIAVKVILVTIWLGLMGGVDSALLTRNREADDVNDRIMRRSYDNFDATQLGDKSDLLNALKSSDRVELEQE